MRQVWITRVGPPEVLELREEDLPAADRIFRLAFGTRLGLPDPLAFSGDADWVAAAVIEQDPVADLHLIPHIIARLVIPHAVPAGDLAGLKVLDRKDVRLGLHQPVFSLTLQEDLRRARFFLKR